MYEYGDIDNRNLFSDCEQHLYDIFDSAIGGPSVEMLPVDGLAYVPDFISVDEEKALLYETGQGVWDETWLRRTQRFGLLYDGTEVGDGQGTPGIPCWALPFCLRLVERGAFEALPNQIGVNEYLPGQGIAPHVDRHGGPVASLSLGSGCVMDLVSLFDKPTVSFWLAPRSLVVIKGEARSAWKHGIARRQKDVINGMAYRRRRRVSITFRKIECPQPEC